MCDFTGHVLVARNLAIAEEMGELDVITPCSGCYKNLSKTSKALHQDPNLLSEVNKVLGERKITNPARVRHPIDVVVTVLNQGDLDVDDAFDIDLFSNSPGKPKATDTPDDTKPATVPLGAGQTIFSKRRGRTKLRVGVVPMASTVSSPS